MLAHDVILILLYVVCVFSSEIYRCPTNIPRNKFLKTYRDQCYQFINNEKYWTEARDDCYSKGGRLVQIRDMLTQDFVYGSLRELQWNRNGLWIGAHDLDSEGVWKWVTGDSVLFNYWDTDQPGGCTFFFFCHEDCATLRLDSGGRWHDAPCSSLNYVYSYICQYGMRPATTTSTTTAPTTTSTTTQSTSTTPSTTTTVSSTAVSRTKTSKIPLTGTDYSTTTLLSRSPVPITKRSTYLTLVTRVKTTATTPDILTSKTLPTFPSTNNSTNSVLSGKSDNQNGNSNIQENTTIYTGVIAGVVATLSFLFGIIITLVIKRKIQTKTNSMGFNNVAYSAHEFKRKCRPESNEYAVVGDIMTENGDTSEYQEVTCVQTIPQCNMGSFGYNNRLRSDYDTLQGVNTYLKT